MSAKATNCSWYYNWGIKPGEGIDGIEFVPLIKKGSQVNARAIQQVNQLKQSHGVTHLLGFNEPERAKQGDTSVAKAIALWPQLESTGLRLGSPACSGDIGMRWLQAFMKEVERNNLRVDFIAVHWYGNIDNSRDGADKMERWLERLYREYKRPIWITEFNGWQASSDEQLKFMKRMVPKLEKLKFVERYAWFGSLHVGGDADNLDPLGTLYREADE